MSPRTDLKVILRFSRYGESNFCAVHGCSNRSKGGKDKGYYRIPAIVSRSKPKKQALSAERRATWLARIRREDLAADATEYYRVCGDHFISGT